MIAARSISRMAPARAAESGGMPGDRRTRSGAGGEIVAHPLVIGIGHQRHQLGKAELAPPPESVLRLPRVADEKINLRRAVEFRVDAYDRLAAPAVGAAFARTRARPFDVEAEVPRRGLDKGAHGAR